MLLARPRLDRPASDGPGGRARRPRPRRHGPVLPQSVHRRRGGLPPAGTSNGVQIHRVATLGYRQEIRDQGPHAGLPVVPSHGPAQRPAAAVARRGRDLDVASAGRRAGVAAGRPETHETRPLVHGSVPGHGGPLRDRERKWARPPDLCVLHPSLSALCRRDRRDQSVHDRADQALRRGRRTASTWCRCGRWARTSDRFHARPTGSSGSTSSRTSSS